METCGARHLDAVEGRPYNPVEARGGRGPARSRAYAGGSAWWVLPGEGSVRLSARRLAICVLVYLISAVAAGEVQQPFVLSLEFRRAPPPAVEVVIPQRLSAPADGAPTVAQGEKGGGTEARTALPPPPKVDGILDDPCWQQAGYVVVGSDVSGGDASRVTRARVCWDATNLYVAFECREPALHNYPTWTRRTDGLPSENVQVLLQPRSDSAKAYRLAIDPNEATYAWSFQEGVDWKPRWTARAMRRLEEWTAEIAIPFEAIGSTVPVEGEAWRFNLCRDVAETGEQYSWQPTSGNRLSPAMWGLLFFGSPEAYRGRKVPPRIRAHPERFALDGTDKLLRVVVAIDPGSDPLAKLQLRIASSRKPITGTAFEPLASVIFAPIEGERAILTVNADALPVGRSYVTADLLDAQGDLLGRSAFGVERRALEATAVESGCLEVIVPPVQVDGPVARNWPIATGVALPKGALLSDANMRLLGPDGKEVPLQTVVRSRWSDGSLRWVGLDFRADVGAAVPQRFVLEYGPKIRRAPVAGFIRKVQRLPFDVVGETWVVNTGALLFTVNQQRFAGIEEAWVDCDYNGRYDWSEQILNGSRGGYGPFLQDAAGNVYRMSGNVNVELEEWNELRLVLKGEGPLVLVERAPGTDQEQPVPEELGRCCIRVTAYAGFSFVRVQYAFVLNRRAGTTLIGDLGVREKLDFRYYRAAFGVPQGYRESIRRSGDVYFMWLSPDRFVVKSDGPEAPADLSGTEAEDWAYAGVQDRGILVVLGDMRHLYPKSFEIKSDGNLDIHFWPPHGTEQDRAYTGKIDRTTVGGLAFAHHGRFLDLRVPPAYSSDLKDRHGLSDFDAVKGMQYADPGGIALIYDALYYFHRGAYDQDLMSTLARTFEMAPHATQDRESLARSGVLDAMLPPERADRAVRVARRLLELEGRFREEGDFNYLDLHREWLPDENRWALSRRWMGTTADLPGALWLLYLQTGAPDMHRLARRNLRHVLAVDFCHDATPDQTLVADPRRRKVVGGFCDSLTPLHWQGVCHVNDRHARVRAFLLAYSLTGDRFADEALRLWAESARTRAIPAPGEDGLALLDNLWTAIEQTYDPVLLERLGEAAEFFASHPCHTLPIESWVPGLRRYVSGRHDPAPWGPLNALAKETPALERYRLRFALTSILRDLHYATGDAAFGDDIAVSLSLFERKADEATALQGPDDGGLTWLDLCAYIFAGAEPVQPEDAR